jgi:hypothetical protein
VRRDDNSSGNTIKFAAGLVGRSRCERSPNSAAPGRGRELQFGDTVAAAQENSSNKTPTV